MKRCILWMSISIVLPAMAMACSGPDPQSGQWSPPELTRTAAVNNPTAAASATATQVPGNPGGTSEPDPAPTDVDPTGAANPTATSSNPDNPGNPGSPEPAGTPENSPSPTGNPDPTDTVSPSPSATTIPEPTATMGDDVPGVLPEHRVLSYYGHPSTGQMGILGEYSKEELYQRLQEQAAAYEAADPDTPVKLAFEIIATVAQPNPGSDGTYLLYTGDEWIGEYVEFAAERDMLVILDLQIGHSTVRAEMERVSHWLVHPNVHVALDPEFSTAPDWAPGEAIGSVDGNHIQIAVEILSGLARQHDLPAKMLIVHQFENTMIFNKNQIEPLPGVDVIIDVDGFGTPEAKVGDYNVFVKQQPIEYGGIKLFYKQDEPLMTPEEVVALKPKPMVVIYQ